MHGLLLAQVRGAAANWFEIALGSFFCLMSIRLLLMALIPAGSSNEEPARDSPQRAWQGAVLTGALGYFWLGRQFGWPVPGAGLAVLQTLFTQLAVLGCAAVIWFWSRRLLKKSVLSGKLNDRDFEGPELRDLLEEGEAVIWQGQPDVELFASESWAAFVFGQILLLPGAAGVGLTMLGVQQQGFAPAFAVPLFAGLGFLTIGVHLIQTPWRSGKCLARAQYAVTDRRAIVLRPPGWNPDWFLSAVNEPSYVFAGEVIRNRTQERKSKYRTDLVFLREPHGRRRRTNYVSIGFLGLRRWEEIDQLLAKTFDQNEDVGC